MMADQTEPLTADERAELEALRALARVQADANAGNVAPSHPTHVAFLANGERHEYSGAHPTHVGTEGGPTVPVVAVYPLSV